MLHKVFFGAPVANRGRDDLTGGDLEAGDQALRAVTHVLAVLALDLPCCIGVTSRSIAWIPVFSSQLMTCTPCSCRAGAAAYTLQSASTSAWNTTSSGTGV